MSSQLQRFYPESRFGGYSRVDGTVAFYTRANALLRPDDVVLDIGCGRGPHASKPDAWLRNMRVFKGRCGRVIGIDVDPAAQENPFLDEFRLIQGSRWPVEDASVDLGVCDFVLEHIEDPQTFFSECARVIKPGGYICIRSANRLGYVGLLSTLIPERFHHRVLKAAQPDRVGEAYYTFHRCNTVGKVRRLLGDHGFDACVFGQEAEPAYFGFSSLLYGLAKIVHSLTPGFLCTCFFAYGRRQETTSPRI